MKIVKTANDKKDKIKISRAEWTDLGVKAGWMKEAQALNQLPPMPSPDNPRGLPPQPHKPTSMDSSNPSYQRVVKHYQELQHALKTQNAPAAGQAKQNLKQMKDFFESNGVNWKSDPTLLEALSDI